MRARKHRWSIEAFCRADISIHSRQIATKPTADNKTRVEVWLSAGPRSWTIILNIPNYRSQREVVLSVDLAFRDPGLDESVPLLV